MRIGHADVLIAGGGPAGAAAAIALCASGAGVLVVERTRYEEERVGETVNGDIATLLQALECHERFLSDGHEPAPVLVSRWGSEEVVERNAVFDPFGNGWHLDRRRFDRMLAARAEAAGARIVTGARVVSCEAMPDGRWRSTVSVGDDEQFVETDFVVDATGRPAALSRSFGRQKEPVDRLVAIVAIGRDRRTPADPRTLIETTHDGWWYSARLPGERAVFVRLTDADLLRRSAESLADEWRHALHQTQMTRERAAAFEPESVRLVSAASHRLDRFAGERWIAAGDAAFAYDPLSGQGIAKGLASGLRAAAALAARDSSDYERWCEESFEAYLAERRRYYSLERRWPDTPFWQRRR